MIRIAILIVVFGAKTTSSLVNVQQRDVKINKNNKLIFGSAVEKSLELFNLEYSLVTWLQQSADWNFSTNQTKRTASIKAYGDELFSTWMAKWKRWGRIESKLPYLSPYIQRALEIISNGTVFHDPSQARAVSEMRSSISFIFSSAIINNDDGGINLHGEDDVVRYMSSLRDPRTLKNVWTEWQTKVSSNVKPLFQKLTKTMNEAATETGYTNAGASWREELAMGNNLVSTAMNLWKEVEEFYKQLHAYVRAKLRDVYGEQLMPPDGLLPVHLLSSLWGDRWESLFDLLIPYPTFSLPNITTQLRSNVHSVKNLFRIAEQMYVSMGLEEMVPSFWSKSMFTKPDDQRLVDCHGAAYDFAATHDYRIRICTKVSEEDLRRAIHEVGHIEYYMAYHHLPMVLRGGASSAFHEAVGEAMVYASYSPICLKKMGFRGIRYLDKETEINILMKQALSKIVFLPWALVIDIWRYEVFDNKSSMTQLMEKWWKLRAAFQGVKAPDNKSSKFCDPCSKYHVAVGIPYIRYFFSRFLEHQFHKALCDTSSPEGGWTAPLNCCFLGSHAAGKKLKKMLAAGASKPWQDTLQEMTGYDELSAKPLMDYYEPLYMWLLDYNRRHNITVGW